MTGLAPKKQRKKLLKSDPGRSIQLATKKEIPKIYTTRLWGFVYKIDQGFMQSINRLFQ